MANSTLPKMPVPLSGGAFKFDGSSSDLAQLLYRRYVEGATVAVLAIDESRLPERIQARLNKTGSSFAALPGILQRALLWDSGYTLDHYDKLVQIKTRGGRSMADIAVSAAEYSVGAGCTPTNCSTPTGGTTLRSKICDGEQMMRVTKCMAADVTNPSLHSPMWGLGGDPDLTPEIKIKDHNWIDDSTNIHYSVYAIHTENRNDEAVYGECPQSGYDAFVIPCSVTDLANATTRAEMSEPQMSAWVDTMIAAFPDPSMPSPTPSITSSPGTGNGSGISVGALIGIGVGALVFIGIVVIIVARKCRHNSPKESAHHEGGVDPNPLLVLGANQAGRSGSSQAETASSGDQCVAIGRPSEDHRSSSSDSVLRALLTDPNLVDCRLVFEKLAFKKMVSKGAYGEVWMCKYDGQDVAVKRLLQTKNHTFDQVREFTNEIQLTASLQHPNVIGFVGVAWTSLENLVMAVEYLPRGDLQSYLKKNGELLSWARDKVHLALGIARALEYLHSRSPPLIHRDLKSKNVLLTYHLDPKLIDFGVSRSFQLEEMTAGVGTPYWTAPEVLESTTYSERSDIYSFGVLLSEIDTCELPYFDATGSSGEKLKSFQILNSVMTGTLVPSFTPSCPPCVREMAAACFARDPAKRPSASELVKTLERF